jgi:hypothetical protein
MSSYCSQLRGKLLAYLYETLVTNVSKKPLILQFSLYRTVVLVVLAAAAVATTIQAKVS